MGAKMGANLEALATAPTVVVALDNTYEGMGSKDKAWSWVGVVCPASVYCCD